MGKIHTAVKVTRLISLDALRGFNMFWIIGTDKIADSLKQLNFPGAHFLTSQLTHAQWNGFTFYDLIYAMFIFIVGVSTAFSIKRRQEKGENRFKILSHILFRTSILFLLGIYMSNSGLSLHGWLTNIRWMGVLQRIALCYCGAGILVLFTKPRYQAIVASVFLIGYYLLLRLVPVPGYGAAVWNPPVANFANYFDSLFLPGRHYYGSWDVEGLLSTFPAMVTCLFGVFTGYWLRGEWRIRGKLINQKQKALVLATIGVIIVGLGLLWGMDFPINKKIWTSSYVLLTGGLSFISMAIFYWFIDIQGYKKWAFPFVVIGLNSIFIYLVANLIPFWAISRWLTGGELLNWFGNGQALCLTMVTFLIEWLVLYMMYRQKVFLKL
jgi:predicted acyltransferase